MAEPLSAVPRPTRRDDATHCRTPKALHVGDPNAGQPLPRPPRLGNVALIQKGAGHLVAHSPSRSVGRRILRFFNLRLPSELPRIPIFVFRAQALMAPDLPLRRPVPYQGIKAAWQPAEKTLAAEL